MSPPATATAAAPPATKPCLASLGGFMWLLTMAFTTASSLIKGQGPAGPQPQRLPLIGQQGEDLGILNLLSQLALALIEQLIG